ncbi:MAG: hypothetical protein ACJAUL_003704 [Paraglaciecola sp.]|jgi:hypothetical protein
MGGSNMLAKPGDMEFQSSISCELSPGTDVSYVVEQDWSYAQQFLGRHAFADMRLDDPNQV